MLLLDGAGDALELPAAPGAALIGLLGADELLEPPVPGAPNAELDCDSGSSPSPALQAVMQAAERHASAAADSRDETEMRRIFMTYGRP